MFQNLGRRLIETGFRRILDAASNSLNSDTGLIVIIRHLTKYFLLLLKLSSQYLRKMLEEKTL